MTETKINREDVDADRVRRQVWGVSVTYFDVQFDLVGNSGQVVKTAQRGEFINPPSSEIERLDGLDMLVPVGREVEGDPGSVRDHANRTISENAAKTVARALNPLDVAFPGPSILPPTVSPPPGGVAPVGDITTGDTGIGDTQPVVADDGGGLPIVVEPPDAALADSAEIASWIESESPNIDATVSVAENNPEYAKIVLEAEQAATSGDPRVGVTNALQKIIDGGAGS